MLLSRADHPQRLVWQVCLRNQPETGEVKGHRCHRASAVSGQRLQTHPHRVLEGPCVCAGHMSARPHLCKASGIKSHSVIVPVNTNWCTLTLKLNL